MSVGSQAVLYNSGAPTKACLISYFNLHSAVFWLDNSHYFSFRQEAVF
jgi:hypothetical protein